MVCSVEGSFEVTEVTESIDFLVFYAMWKLENIGKYGESVGGSKRETILFLFV